AQCADQSDEVTWLWEELRLRSRIRTRRPAALPATAPARRHRIWALSADVDRLRSAHSRAHGPDRGGTQGREGEPRLARLRARRHLFDGSGDRSVPGHSAHAEANIQRNERHENHHPDDEVAAILVILEGWPDQAGETIANEE